MTTIPTTVKNRKLVVKRREQIILAAIRLFSQKGFYKTTLKDLAEAAELSYGNVYDYVGGKEDIIYLIHEYVYGLILEGLQTTVAQVTDPIDKLRRMVRFEFSIMDRTADAILILYHYSHILKNEYLYKLLKAEREHLQQFETVLRECIDQGLIRDGNVRLTANLIKSMIDAWVLKRWDLRGYVTVPEAEAEILDMALNGLILKKEGAEPTVHDGFSTLEGRTVLVVNGGTPLGAAVCNSMTARGARVAVYGDNLSPSKEYPLGFDEEEGKIRLYPAEKHGAPTPELFREIASETGSIDIFIQDLGLGTTRLPVSKEESLEAARRLEANLGTAQDLSQFFLDDSSSRPLSRIIFLAPWAWDRYAGSIRFETVLAGLEALTREMSRLLGTGRINVNCIVPGFIKTPRPSAIEAELTTDIMDHISAGRLGRLDDVANAAVFLAGDASGYATGQTIEITGGLNQVFGGKEKC